MSFIAPWRDRDNTSRTVLASGTLADDINRQAPGRVVVVVNAMAALVIRMIASARKRIPRACKRTVRRVSKADSRQRKLAGYRVGRLRWLNRESTRDLMAQVVQMQSHLVLLGFLPVFINYFLVGLIVVSAAITESPFAEVTIRVFLDVPTSKGTFAVGDPAVMQALSTALILGVVLIVLPHVGGRALAWLLFGRPRAALEDETKEMARAGRLLPTSHRVLICVITLPLVLGVTAFMRGLAQERIAAMPSTSEGAAELMTNFITLVLVGALLLQTIAEIPVFAHARHTKRAAAMFAVRQWWTVFYEARLTQGAVRSYQRAWDAAAHLSDILKDVTLRAAAEAVEAGLTTGAATVVEEDPTAPPELGDETDTSNPKVLLSGALGGGYLPGAPKVNYSTTANRALKVWNQLQVPDTEPVLPAAWSELRGDRPLTILTHTTTTNNNEI